MSHTSPIPAGQEAHRAPEPLCSFESSTIAATAAKVALVAASFIFLPTPVNLAVGGVLAIAFTASLLIDCSATRHEEVVYVPRWVPRPVYTVYNWLPIAPYRVRYLPAVRWRDPLVSYEPLSQRHQPRGWGRMESTRVAAPPMHSSVRSGASMRHTPRDGRLDGSTRGVGTSFVAGPPVATQPSRARHPLGQGNSLAGRANRFVPPSRRAIPRPSSTASRTRPFQGGPSLGGRAGRANPNLGRGAGNFGHLGGAMPTGISRPPGQSATGRHGLGSRR